MELPRVAAEVVELAPTAVAVFDVDVARRVDRDVRWRSANTESVLAEIFEEVVAAPGRLVALEERDEAVAVLRRARVVFASSLIVEAKSMFSTGAVTVVPFARVHGVRTTRGT